jgi:hypothetical protein
MIVVTAIAFFWSLARNPAICRVKYKYKTRPFHDGDSMMWYGNCRFQFSILKPVFSFIQNFKVHHRG